MSAIDLAPIINQVVMPLMSPVIVVVATWAAGRFAALVHLQTQDSQRRLVTSAIENGIAYAERLLAGHESVSAGDTVATAVKYILPKVPEALAALGITPDHLEQLVTARLPRAA